MARSVYIHGTAPSEQSRLAALNRLTNRAFIDFLGIEPGLRVLEVGSGLGILAAEVSASAEGVRVVGVEISADQIGAAAASPGVEYVQGDAHELRFADGSFDLVYARYLLEHVGDPVGVLGEMRRVTRAGGRVAVMENDVSLLRFDPPCPAFEEVWSLFARYQSQLGGDAEIGRRLYRLFRAAGLARVELSFQPEIHWHGSPGFDAWVENIAGNIASAEGGLIESGACSRTRIDQAMQELAELRQRDNASVGFAWNRALGFNPR